VLFSKFFKFHFKKVCLFLIPDKTLPPLLKHLLLFARLLGLCPEIFCGATKSKGW